MATSYSPATVLAESGRAVAATLTRVYLVSDGTDAETGHPVIALSNTGPATYAYFYDSGTNELLLSDNPNVTGALKTVLSGGALVLYE